MVPHSFSTTTASSMRIGCVIASCTPANRLLSTGRAARPATMPATPAEANRLTPYCRTGSKVISAAPTVTITTSTSAARNSTRTCVTCLRASRLSSVSSRNCRR